MLDIKEILEILPHRYPFLLIDRIEEIEEGKRIVGIKNVSINEPYFQGHFPEIPIMPGVLIIEAMAQTWGILVLGSNPQKVKKEKKIYFAGIDKARFRKPVVPGDQIRFELELIKKRGGLWKFKGKAFVKNSLVAEAELMATISDK